MTYLFANWKMYQTVEESLSLARVVADLSYDSKKVDMVIFPSTFIFREVAEILNTSTVNVGAQDVHWVAQGAYTGATSAHTFASSGATHALVGHSERRYIFDESNDETRKKAEACFDAGLTVVLCVGETKEDVETGKQIYRLERQLTEGLRDLSIPPGKLIVAYEPVWAISNAGTGAPCMPEDAAIAAGNIRKILATITNAHVPVVYGGSVDAENVRPYLEMDGIDGILVGHASVHADSWTSIVQTVQE